MPRLENGQIPANVKETMRLHRVLNNLGAVKPNPGEYVERYKTPDGADVFIVSQIGEKGILTVNQVTYPSSANPLLGGIFNAPFSTSDRQPGEEGA
jgi:hypothetical protein